MPPMIIDGDKKTSKEEKSWNDPLQELDGPMIYARAKRMKQSLQRLILSLQKKEST